jgi:hypothetical protein
VILNSRQVADNGMIALNFVVTLGFRLLPGTDSFSQTASTTDVVPLLFIMLLLSILCTY